MCRKLIPSLAVAGLLILVASIVHAQQRLDRPANLSFANDTLAWDAVENAGGYRVRWRAGNAQWDSAYIPSSPTTFDFSTLPLNTTYTVQVRARADNTGNYLNSFWSAAFTIQRRPTPTPTVTNTPTNTSTPTATVTVAQTPTNAPLKQLTSPRNLRHQGYRSVAWDSVTGAIGYRLRWSQPGGSWSFRTVGASPTFYTITALNHGVLYEVQVRALGDETEYEKRSPWSGVVQLRPGTRPTMTFTPTATPAPSSTPIPTNKPIPTATPIPTSTPTATATPTPRPLERPANLRHVSGSTVAWDAVTGATGYRLRWGLPGGSKEFRTVGASPLRYEISGLTLNTLYEVQVRALGDEKEYEKQGPWSGILQINAAATLTPSRTPIPSDAPTPTATQTHTLIPPTNTPLPTETPTATPTNSPTNTPLPTDTPTNTPLPTDTPIPTDTPTSAPLPTDTPTNTPLPTDTPTNTPLPTDTPIPTDTPTSTPLPTNTPIPTDTPLPTDTPTNTPIPPTNTPIPPTNTPIPPTPTPIPLLAPTNFRLVSDTTVAWHKVRGAIGYAIEWSPADGGGNGGYQEVGIDTTGLTLSNIAVGVTYNVAVQARGDGSEYESRGPWSSFQLYIKPTLTPTPIPTNTPKPVPTATPSTTDEYAAANRYATAADEYTAADRDARTAYQYAAADPDAHTSDQYAAADCDARTSHQYAAAYGHTCASHQYTCTNRNSSTTDENA